MLSSCQASPPSLPHQPSHSSHSSRRPHSYSPQFQKDEATLLPDWLWHHARIVGLSNIVVVDHSSTEPRVRALLQALVPLGLDVRSFNGPFNEKAGVLTALVREMAADADILIPLDRSVRLSPLGELHCARARTRVSTLTTSNPNPQPPIPTLATSSWCSRTTIP